MTQLYTQVLCNYCVDRRSCSYGDNNYRVTVHIEQTWKRNDDRSSISLWP